MRVGFRKYKDGSSTCNSPDPKHCCQPAKTSLAPKELQPGSFFTLVLISFERSIVLLVFVYFLPQGSGEAGKAFSAGSSSGQIIRSRSEVTGKIRIGQRLKEPFVRKTGKTDNSYY